jgi:hypothetical protein
MLTLSWAGLAVSGYHEHFDAIIRIPVVLFFGVGGVMLGA